MLFYYLLLLKFALYNFIYFFADNWVALHLLCSSYYITHNLKAILLCVWFWIVFYRSNAFYYFKEKIIIALKLPSKQPLVIKASKTLFRILVLSTQFQNSSIYKYHFPEITVSFNFLCLVRRISDDHET